MGRVESFLSGASDSSTWRFLFLHRTGDGSMANGQLFARVNIRLLRSDAV